MTFNNRISANSQIITFYTTFHFSLYSSTTLIFNWNLFNFFLKTFQCSIINCERISQIKLYKKSPPIYFAFSLPLHNKRNWICFLIFGVRNFQSFCEQKDQYARHFLLHFWFDNVLLILDAKALKTIHCKNISFC